LAVGTAADAHPAKGSETPSKSDPTAACRTWKAALAIFRELGIPEAADVAERLTEPPTLAT
jgi:hypothetical protein